MASVAIDWSTGVIDYNRQAVLDMQQSNQDLFNDFLS
jgi:hypothetical protein